MKVIENVLDQVGADHGIELPIPKRQALDFGGEKFEARATAVTAGPERDRLYAQHASTFPGFLDYERQTSRTIPVVLLERI